MRINRDIVYLTNLANYYKTLFYMLLDGVNTQDNEKIEKAKKLMETSENIN